jgi:hypothetical protein
LKNLENIKALENPYESLENKKSICSLWLHANDLSHTSKDIKTAESWAVLINKEFT